IILIHGGPGAAGSMSSLANVLKADYGIIESIQTKTSIKDLINEIKLTINECCNNLPVIIIGHSWGAWLAFIYASIYPEDITKLVIIGAASFEEKYNINLMKKRLNRLTQQERSEIETFIKSLNIQNQKNINFDRFNDLMIKADSYKIVPGNEKINFDIEIYNSIWKEAEVLRRSGELLSYGINIKCPVVAIHGLFDPHPSDGVEIPIKKIISEFKIYKLNKCGHYPWKEKYALNEFFSILNCELK
ncbi:alpha/beta fold hydrolase, partial [Bacteroidota bacterium]